MAACFVAGIALARYGPDPAGLYFSVISAGVSILAGLLILRAGWGRVAVGFALAAMVLIGSARWRLWDQRFPLNHVRYLGAMGVDLNNPVHLTGRVVSTPYRAGHSLQFDVEAGEIESLGRSHAVSGVVRLRLGSAEDSGAPGKGPLSIRFDDEVRAIVRLERPHVYQNPGSFDYRLWMQDIEDLYWEGAIRNPRRIEIMGHASGHRIADALEFTRQKLLRAIDDLYPPWSIEGRNGAVLKAVLWGDRTALDAGTIDDFRKTGLYHLLVIAGLHVGLLTLLVEFLLRAVGCRNVTRAFLVLGFLGVYSMLVGQRAPTLRATLMIALYLLGRILDREHSSLNAIGGVALILLYYRPAWLFESGFQLSFAAALLIVSVAVPILEHATEPYRRALLRLDDVLLDDRFSPRIAQVRLDVRALINGLRRRAGFFNRFPALSRNMVAGPLKLLVWLANMFVFSAVLQLGLLLPMVATFHRVTFAGVGLNALAIPVMTVLLALALPVNILAVASPAVAAWPAKLLSLVMAVLFRLTHLPAQAPWLSYRIPTPPASVAWGFCTSFVVAALALRYVRRAVAPALAVCAVFVAVVAVHPFAPRLPRGVLQVTALDCGSGDAFFVAFPDGATMLVDAGGDLARVTHLASTEIERWDPGEDIVSPFLWSLGIKRLDVVAVTPAGADRLGGLRAILANFEMGEFWHAPLPESADYTALLDMLAKKGTPTRTLVAGDSFKLGNASVQVLWPSGDAGNTLVGYDPKSVLVANRAAGFDVNHASSADDQSLVMRFSTSGGSFVLDPGGTALAWHSIPVSQAPMGRPAVSFAYFGAQPPGALLGFAPAVAVINSRTAIERSGPPPNSVNVLSQPRAGLKTFRPPIDGAVTVAWKDAVLGVRTYRKTE